MVYAEARRSFAGSKGLHQPSRGPEVLMRLGCLCTHQPLAARQDLLQGGHFTHQWSSRLSTAPHVQLPIKDAGCMLTVSSPLPNTACVHMPWRLSSSLSVPEQTKQSGVNPTTTFLQQCSNPLRLILVSTNPCLAILPNSPFLNLANSTPKAAEGGRGR